MNQPHIQKIIDLELSLLRDEIRASPQQVAALLSEDFLEFGQSGNVYTKADIVREIASWQDLQYEAAHIAAKEITNEIVLITYRSTATSRSTGKVTYALRSSLWKKMGSDWKMMFHQGTPYNGSLTEN